MIEISLLIAFLNILLGVIFYGAGVLAPEDPSLTALIPLVFGGIILIATLVARSSQDKLKAAMHTNMVVAGIGVLVGLYPVVMNLLGGEFGAAFWESLIMAVLLGILLIMGFRAFQDAQFD